MIGDTLDRRTGMNSNKIEPKKSVLIKAGKQEMEKEFGEGKIKRTWLEVYVLQRISEVCSA